MKSSAEWDERFRRQDGPGMEADAFLVRSADAWGQLTGREAADVACGSGRNAAFLAQSGFRVTVFDHSPEALRLTAEQAGDGLVEARRIDLETADADLGTEAFDLVCVVRFLHRPLFPVLHRAVKPGGLVIYHTFTTDNLALEGGPRDPRFLLEPGELLRQFPGWRVLRYEEEWRGRGTAALLARKP